MDQTQLREQDKRREGVRKFPFLSVCYTEGTADSQTFEAVSFVPGYESNQRRYFRMIPEQVIKNGKITTPFSTYEKDDIAVEKGTIAAMDRQDGTFIE